MSDVTPPVQPLQPWTEEWTLRTRNLKELWENIGNASFATGNNTRIVWRGMGNSAFEVKSSLIVQLGLEDEQVQVTEEAVREREDEYLRRARDWGVGVSEYGRASDLHLLALLQHHGVPTRLIDVTYNPLTALWFACQDPKFKDVPGVLVAFMVTNTKQFVTTDTPSLSFELFDTPERANREEALRTSRDLGSPVMVIPQKPDLRMRAQEGLFITSVVPAVYVRDPSAGLPAADPSGFKKARLRSASDKSSDYLRKKALEGPRTFSMIGMVIEPELKQQVKYLLENGFNRSPRTMYPDLSGLVQAIQADFPTAR